MQRHSRSERDINRRLAEYELASFIPIAFAIGAVAFAALVYLLVRS